MARDILSSHSVQIIMENALLTSLMNLRSDCFDYWTFIEVESLSSNELSLFVSKVSFDELLSDIWLKVIHQLIGIPHDESRRMRYHKGHLHNHFNEQF
jgi:hypothetical protein